VTKYADIRAWPPTLSPTIFVISLGRVVKFVASFLPKLCSRTDLTTVQPDVLPLPQDTAAQNRLSALGGSGEGNDLIGGSKRSGKVSLDVKLLAFNIRHGGLPACNEYSISGKRRCVHNQGHPMIKWQRYASAACAALPIPARRPDFCRAARAVRMGTP